MHLRSTRYLSIFRSDKGKFLWQTLQIDIPKTPAESITSTTNASIAIYAAKRPRIISNEMMMAATPSFISSRKMTKRKPDARKRRKAVRSKRLATTVAKTDNFLIARRFLHCGLFLSLRFPSDHRRFVPLARKFAQ
jgi:hypothetical protein